MKNIIEYLLYYVDFVQYKDKKINSKITYTIPPYQYHKIYAYPRQYI